MFVTLDTTQLLRSALNEEVKAKAVVFGRRKRKVRCEMDQLNTTKDHNYQQFARKDLLRSKVVTLDTTHLLRSALKASASQKAVVFGRRKKKGQM